MLGAIAITFYALVTLAAGYSCPSGWTDISYRCYYFSTAPVADFYQALQSCDDAQGHLISIDSLAEHNVVVAQISTMGNDGNVGWWTSGSNNLRDRSFGWFGTGRRMTSTNFCNGNDDGSVNHCVALDPSCQFAWSIVPCRTANYHYICEKDITID